MNRYIVRIRNNEIRFVLCIVFLPLHMLFFLVLPNFHSPRVYEKSFWEFNWNVIKAAISGEFIDSISA